MGCTPRAVSFTTFLLCMVACAADRKEKDVKLTAFADTTECAKDPGDWEVVKFLQDQPPEMSKAQKIAKEAAKNAQKGEIAKKVISKLNQENPSGFCEGNTQAWQAMIRNSKGETVDAAGDMVKEGYIGTGMFLHLKKSLGDKSSPDDSSLHTWEFGEAADEAKLDLMAWERCGVEDTDAKVADGPSEGKDTDAEVAEGPSEAAVPAADEDDGDTAGPKESEESEGQAVEPATDEDHEEPAADEPAADEPAGDEPAAEPAAEDDDDDGTAGPDERE